MRHYNSVTILSVVAVVGLLVQITGATAYNFDENTADGNGDYLWNEANNWYEYFSPSSRAVPGSTDTAHIAYGRTCILDGTTEEVSALGIGEQSNYAATDTGTLTIRSGSLTTGDAGSQKPLRVGSDYDGTLNVLGGTVSVPSTYAHGSLSVGDSGEGATGYVNQTGGTVEASGTIVLGRNGGNGEYDISGGVLNCIDRINITHTGAVSDSVMTIRGTADVNLTGTGSNDGLHTHEGGTLKIIGGRAWGRTLTECDRAAGKRVWGPRGAIGEGGSSSLEAGWGLRPAHSPFASGSSGTPRGRRRLRRDPRPATPTLSPNSKVQDRRFRRRCTSITCAHHS